MSFFNSFQTVVTTEDNGLLIFCFFILFIFWNPANHMPTLFWLYGSGVILHLVSNFDYDDVRNSVFRMMFNFSSVFRPTICNFKNILLVKKLSFIKNLDFKGYFIFSSKYYTRFSKYFQIFINVLLTSPFNFF